MSWQNLSDLAKQVKDGKATAVGLVEQALEGVKAAEKYGAVLEVNPKAAEEAAKLDAQIARGEFDGRLLGVPFIAKDNFLTLETQTTAGSAILEGFHAPYQSSAVNRLETEGAIMVAKANLDSFAHGSSTENSDFGPTKNPHDITRVPGGSSGGSAAAVALDIVPFALGTDTGGSIRLPASYCGVIGYKPTYGLVSRFGVVAMASSTDVIGPLSRTVDDSALVLDIMSGRDSLDSTTIDRDSTSYTDLDANLSGKTFGLVKEFMSGAVAPEVKASIEATVSKLEAAGATIKEVSIPSIDLALACYYIVMPAEVSSNLSRYDGIKYGFSHGDANNLDEVYDLTRATGFNSETQRRIMIGAYVLSSGYYEAYYNKAQTVRTKLINEFNETHNQVDFLIGPTAPTPAFKLGEKTQDPLTMYLADIMTVGVSLTGMPAINVPVGFDSEGLPIGLQISAKQKADRALLGVAKGVQTLLHGDES